MTLLVHERSLCKSNVDSHLVHVLVNKQQLLHSLPSPIWVRTASLSNYKSFSALLAWSLFQSGLELENSVKLEEAITRASLWSKVLGWA